MKKIVSVMLLGICLVGTFSIAEAKNGTTTAVIGATGGTVTTPEGVRLIIPPGALNKDTVISISSLLSQQEIEAEIGIFSNENTFLGAVSIGAEGITFNKPCILSIPNTICELSSHRISLERPILVGKILDVGKLGGSGLILVDKAQVVGNNLITSLAEDFPHIRSEGRIVFHSLSVPIGYVRGKIVDANENLIEGAIVRSTSNLNYLWQTTSTGEFYLPIETGMEEHIIFSIWEPPQEGLGGAFQKFLMDVYDIWVKEGLRLKEDPSHKMKQEVKEKLDLTPKDEAPWFPESYIDFEAFRVLQYKYTYCNTYTWNIPPQKFPVTSFTTFSSKDPIIGNFEGEGPGNNRFYAHLGGRVEIDAIYPSSFIITKIRITPIVSKIKPLIGKSGSRVEITGLGFDTRIGNTIVKFGGFICESFTTSKNTIQAFVPSGLPDGLIDIVVVVNESEGDTLLFLQVDNTLPEVSNYSPTGVIESKTILANITISANLKDPLKNEYASGINPMSIVMEINGNSYKPNYSSQDYRSGKVSLTLALGEGNHRVILQCNDKAGNESKGCWSFTIKREKDGNGEPPPDGLGGDNPDESYSVSEPNSSQINHAKFVPSVDIGIFSTGFMPLLFNLLNHLIQPSIIFDIEFSPSLVNDYPILIIPSGGLYGMENSYMVKSKLEEYVKSGGTLICFTQQHGYEFSTLPGGEVSGYGWQEDQSCQNSAVYIDTSHPIFAGQTKATLDANVDGYFTHWPGNATILLRRTKNQMPAMLMYPYGKGRVVVSTLYSDWGYGHSQATADEKALIRDLLSWVKNPNPDEDIVEFKPGENINCELQIGNYRLEDAEKVRFIIYNPDKNAIGSQTIDFHLEPEKIGTLTFTFPGQSKLGIWWVNYELLDRENNIVQEEIIGVVFGISKEFTGKPSKDLTFSVTSPSEKVPYGSDIPYTIHIYNQGDTDRNITFKTSYKDWSLRDIPFPKIEETVNVSAHGEASFVHTLEVGNIYLSHHQLIYYAHFYDEDNKPIGSTLKVIWMVSPSIDIDVKTDKQMYRKGEDVAICSKIQNRKVLNYTSSIEILVTDSKNNKIFGTTSTITLLPNGSATMTNNFSLPITLDSEIYIVQAEASYNGNKIGRGATSFEIPKALLAITPALPDYFIPDATNTIAFKVDNIGREDVFSGSVELSLKDVEDSILGTQAQGFGTLSVGSGTVMNVSIFIPQIGFNKYKIEYTLNYKDRAFNGVIENLPSVILKFDLDKPLYKIRNEMKMSLKVINTGRFQQDLEVTTSIPDCNFIDVRNIILFSNGSLTIPYSLLIPDFIPAGLHKVNVTLKLGTSTMTKIFTFPIPEAKLEIDLDKTNYTDGEGIVIRLRNTGGVDARIDYTLKLIDLENITLYETSGVEDIKVNVGDVNIPFNIPDQAVSSQYRINLACTDLKINRKTILEKWINVSGVKANLSITPDKKIYLSDEVIIASAEINNLGSGINNATLQIKAYEPGEGWTNYTNTDSIIDIAVDEDYVWFATYGGVKRYDKNTDTWKDYVNEDVLQGKYLSTIAVEENYVWFGGVEGVVRYDKNSERWDQFPIGTKTVGVSSIAIDGDYVWFGISTYSYDGVERYNKSTGSWTTFTKSDGLLSESIKEIVAGNEAIWITHSYWDGGVSRYDKINGTWGTYTTANTCFPTNWVNSIAIDGNYVWFAIGGCWSGPPPHEWINGALCRYDTVNDNWTKYGTSNGLPGNEVYNIAVDEEYLWFYTWREGVSRWHKETGSCTTFTTFDGLISNYVNSIAVDGNYVWFGTYYGVSRYDKTVVWDTYTTTDGLLNNFITSIAVDEDYVWFGHWEDYPERKGGVSRYNKVTDAWKTFSGNISSCKWTGKILADQTGTYSFEFYAGGYFSRLWIDEELIIDGTVQGPWRKIIPFSEGLHDIKVEWSMEVRYYFGWFELLWIPPGTNIATPIPSDHLYYEDAGTYTSGGLKGEYFGNPNFTDLKLTRIDSITGPYIPYPISSQPLYNVDSITVDGDSVWFLGHEIKRYFKSTDRWETYTIPGTSSIYYGGRYSMAIDGDDVWFATEYREDEYPYPYSEGICVWGYNKSIGTWSAIPKIVGDYWLNLLLVDNDFIWLQFSARYYPWENYRWKYDKVNGTWTSFSIPENVKDYAFDLRLMDGDYLWFMGKNGISKYNKLTDTWTSYTLPGHSGRAMAIDGDYVWVSIENGVGRYDTKNRTWKTYTTNDGLVGSFITSIAVDGKYVWFGTDGGGVSRFQKMGEAIWEKDIPITISNNQTIPVAIGTLSTIGKLYLDAILVSSKGQIIARAENSFFITGKNVFISLETDKRLYKPNEQATITCKVYNGSEIKVENLNLMLKKKIIGLPDEVLLTKTLSLNSGETATFTVTTIADKSFILEGNIDGGRAIEYVNVGSPTLAVTLTCPEVVKTGTNGFSLLIKNLGEVEAITKVHISIANTQQDYGTMTIPVGDSNLITGDFKIPKDEQIIVTIAGDVDKVITQWIKLGEKLKVKIEPENIYPEKIINVPFTLTNTGTFSTEVEVTFTLKIVSNEMHNAKYKVENYYSLGTPSYLVKEDGETKNLVLSISDPELPNWCKNSPKIVIKKVFSHGSSSSKYRAKANLPSIPQITTTKDSIIIKETFYIPAGTSTTGELLFDLKEGDYLLSYDASIFGTGTYSFKVAKNNVAKVRDIEIKTEDGKLDIGIKTENLGANEFIGILSLDTGFYQVERELRLGIGSTATVIFNIGTLSVHAGTYTAQVIILHNGSPLHTGSKSFTLNPEFVIISINGESPEIVIKRGTPTLIFNGGENGTITIGLKNIGPVEGKVETHLIVLDILDETKDIWVKPSEEGTITFSFVLPDDLEEGDYNAELKLQSAELGLIKELSIPFHTKGIKIKVDAFLDKVLYTEGETATLTLSISNLNSLTPPMYAKIQFNGYEEISTFTLVGTVTLTFGIPVIFTGEKLFYGIYMNSGRSIYLNTLYIYQKQEIVLFTEQQVYQAGSTVTVTVIPSENGTLTITAPRYEESYTITGTKTIEFRLPMNLTSGTYRIFYTFQPWNSTQTISGEFKFDVIGYQVRVREAKVDKIKYKPGNKINIRLKIELNKPIIGIVRGWIIDPYYTTYTKFFEKEAVLEAGENLVDLSGTLSARCAGIYRLVYAFYLKSQEIDEELLLTSGAEVFDVFLSPIITLVNPTKGTIGICVTLEGAGFGSYEDIRIDFGTTKTITLTSSDINGVFSTIFTVDRQPKDIEEVIITITGLSSGSVFKIPFIIEKLIPLHLNVIIYPNPFKPDKGNKGITFSGLTEEVKIRIFNIIGELVREVSVLGQTEWQWNTKNDSGEKVSSGIYIYIITNSVGEKVSGKIGIIR